MEQKHVNDASTGALLLPRRHLVLGAASAALAGGWPARAAATVAPDPATWEYRRQQALAPVLAGLNQKFRQPASNSPADLQAALRASLQDGLPIKLRPGSTQLTTGPLALLAAGATKRPVAIFSDGDHFFTGNHPLHTDLPLQLVNLRFEQSRSAQLTAQYVNRLEVSFCRFHNSGARAIVLNPLAVDQGTNALGLRWTDFSGHSYSLYASDLQQARIEFNRCRGSIGRNFQCSGGQDNRFVGNIIEGGITGINCAVQGWLKPPSGQFPRAWNQSHLDTLVEGNLISGISEEAIGFDAMADDAKAHCSIDQFMLARDGGTYYGRKGTPAEPQILVPRDSGAPGVGPIAVAEDLYRHYFVVWLDGPLAGKYAQIHRCSAHNAQLVAFALRSPRRADNRVLSAADPALRPGELTQEDFTLIANNYRVAVCSVAANARVVGNTVLARSFGDRYTTAISFWGAGSGFEVSDNTLLDDGLLPQHRRLAGIRIAHVAGVHAKQNLQGLRSAYGNHSHCTLPASRGRVLGNRLGGQGLRLHAKAYSGAGGFVRATHQAIVRNNSGLYGGAPEIADWTDLYGPIHPLLPTYSRSADLVSGNS